MQVRKVSRTKGEAPATSDEALSTPSSSVLRLRIWVGAHRVDLRNLWLIAAGWVALILLIPPVHDYPVIDDWIFYRSVQHQLATGEFQMPPASQPNLVGLTLWGTLWARFFGLSFTTLTASTLFMALVASCAFYALARTIGIGPGASILGTALLSLNPIFFHLSYSFMTDIPFVALILMSCLCYVKGLQGPRSEVRGQSSRAGPFDLGSWTSELWLAAGGFFAGYSFLIRQFGVIVPLGFLAYLALDGVVTGKWRWREIVGVALVPALMVGGWFIWSHDTPPTVVQASAARRAARFLFKASWPGVFGNRALTLLPVLALFAWTAIRLRKAHLPLVAAWGVILGWGVLAVSFPEESYSFIQIGNIIRVGGIDFFQYSQEPIWSPLVWQGLTLLGVILAALVLGKASAMLIDWLSELKARRRVPPVAALYIVAFGIFVASLALTGDIFDRYLLPIVPIVLLFLLRDSGAWGRVAWGYSLAALVLLTGFTLLAKADFIEHNRARWEAGEWLAARVPLPVDNGYDWDNWKGQSNGVYIITDIHREGYRTEADFPYLSLLSGFTQRYVLAESRGNAFPLREPQGK
jgi:4-amino-4-deoxy-L-arabinose transferase-like glycosyltransferase